MKNIKYSLLAGLLAIVLLPACDVLDQDSVLQVSPEQAFTSESLARSAVNGIYDAMQEADYYGGRFQYSSDNVADVGFYAGFTVPFQELDNKIIPATNGNVANIWQAIFASINVANEVIAGVPLVEEEGFTEEERSSLLAEARALRALFNMDLLLYFGEHWDPSSSFGIPLVSTTNGGDFTRIENPSRSSVADSYQFILDDLNFAEGVLADSDDRTRVSLGMVQALLSRVYIYRGDYANAEAYATAVIDNPNYNLAADPTDIYFSDLTEESIFELVYNTLDPSSLALWTIRRDEVRPEEGLLASFEEGDLRRSLIREIDGFNGERFFKAEDFANDANPAYILRVAEMYINRAEARFLTGNVDGALEDLNAVRTRAGLPAHESADDFVNKHLNEVRWEFFGEGHRLPVLARLGQAASVLDIDPFRQIYPIPFNELNVEGNQLVQNPGY
ncbi:MAG: RagB/SusD family nutrient uptake outer membrane protein [Bacteroidota bacterium]